MSLIFFRGKRSLESRWILYALLRDNVQHHIPGHLGEALNAIGAALGGQRIEVDALQLHDEARVARSVLARLPQEKLAVSRRTRAVISLEWPVVEPAAGPGCPPATELCDEKLSAQLLLDRSPPTLGELFAPLLDRLIEITTDAHPGDKVEVMDS